MAANNSQSISRVAGYTVLVFVVLGMTGWGYWTVSAQQNDASFMIDINWSGDHLCPNQRFPELNVPLPDSSIRPNENELWNDRLKAEEASIRFAYSGDNSGPSKEYIDAEVVNSLRPLRRSESHYRIEVRRSILEMEARRPLCMPSYGPIREWPTCDETTGVPLLGGYCYPLYPHHAHECARHDVLIWYAKRSIYPANSNKLPALTLRSSRTPPALPFALPQHFAISAPFIASAQAWPLSFIR